MKIFLDTSPLVSGHAHRGIGSYTRSLKKSLAQTKKVQLVSSAAAADLIHYPFFDFFEATLPFFKQKPTVITIHDVIPLQFSKQYPAGIKGKIKLFLQQIALSSVARIITDSEASKTNISKYLGVKQQSIDVVPLAANKKISYVALKDQKIVAKKYNLPSKFALYVGDINYNKNIPGLLKSFSQVKSKLQLVCVGKNFREQDIPEWERIQNTITKHHLQNSVVFLNNVDSTSDLAAIYSQAAVYIQPSLAEGFGLPILEAMQCHTPVIAYKKSAMKEVGGNHIVYPSAVQNRTLAETIDEVVAMHNHDRRKWVLQAYSWSQTFSWQKTAQKTIAVYKKALQND
jgi:glycosyltransferase involved in cell wall biosynthesis